MRRLICLAAAALWSAAVLSAAFAYPERVEEVWRSPYGNDRISVSAQAFAPSPSDRSFWMIDGATIEHYAADGTLLFRSQLLSAPWALATDPVNGSCWVLQGTKDELLHFGADGTLLSATPGPSHNATLLSSPADGSVWVSDSDRATHVNASGAIVWASSVAAQALAADPEDGSVWMLEGGALTRRTSSGAELWRVTGFGADVRLGEDPRNQSVWIGDENSRFAHISATGQVLAEKGGSSPLLDVQVLPADGSLWVRYASDAEGNAYVARLDASGTEVFRVGSGLEFTNLHDGSAWITRYWFTSLFSADGALMYDMDSTTPYIAFDPVDSGYWTMAPAVAPVSLSRYQADGALLWSQQRVGMGWRLWADSSDGSCWVTEHYREGTTITHVSPEGEALGRMPVPPSQVHMGSVELIAASATDDTWWAKDGSALVHVAADGTELWRQPGVIPGLLLGFQVSPLDGSVWVTGSVVPDVPGLIPPNSHLVHLSADGAIVRAVEFDSYLLNLAVTAGGEVWAICYDGINWVTEFLRFSPTGEATAEVPFPVGLFGMGPLQVNPSDGSLYVVAASVDASSPPSEVVFRMAADGTVLWQVAGFYLSSIAVVPEDGSLWVADRDWYELGAADLLAPGSQVVHLGANGQCLWRGDTFDAPEQLSVNSYDGTAWLYDLGNLQVVHLRAVMPPFPDVTVDSWALDAIAACAAAGIVQGYWNGYHPDEVVTRDQMAVYVSRALAGGDEGVQVPSGLAEPTFTDVDEEHWAYRHIEYCFGAKIVEGYPGGGYRPGEAVNRGQMAVYIARARVTPSGDAAIPDPSEGPTFTDVTADNEWSWCYLHVEYCAAANIVQGYWDGTYHPERPVTRDQMAVYIARAFHLPL